MCYDVVMHRTFGKPREDNPEVWDYFVIKSRWNRKRKGVDLFLINYPAEGGEERTKVEVSPHVDYHGEVTAITEELLDDGWQER